jgi:hypothetical protein
VDWCVSKWLAEPGVEGWLGLRVSTPDQWRPKTVSIHPDTAQAHPGDIVVFDFSHVGIVEFDADDKLITIEGNTNGRGDRDSATGDGVWRKTRPKSLARNFIRIHPRGA